MLCGEFKYIIFKHISQVENQGGQEIKAEQTIYLFVGNTAPKTGALLSEIYEAHKSEDGFLYLTYSAENTLGAQISF
jgi:GABA(A) receptor-associated protein